DVVVHRERRSPPDTPNLASTFRVDLDEPVIPTDALREPFPPRARPFGAEHESAIVVDALAQAQQNQGILEILRVHRQGVSREDPPERVAARERYARRDAVVGQALLAG